MSIIAGSELSHDAHIRLDDFGSRNMAHFDESHNWQHVLNVYDNMLKIVHGDSIEYDQDLLTYMVKLHDVRDHKYPNSISEQTLIDFLDTEVGEIKRKQIMLVIDGVSFSKQVANETKQSGISNETKQSGISNETKQSDTTGNGKYSIITDNKLREYLTIVRDADRLEAIGTVGIERCIKYQTVHGNRVPDVVLFHCHEKLLRLLPEHFIVNPTARKMAEPLHQQIVDYVLKHHLLDSEVAASRGRVQDLEWLRSHNCQLSTNCFNIALAAGHNNVCKWLITNGYVNG